MSRSYEAVQETLVPEMQDVESIGEVIANAADRWDNDRYMSYGPSGDSFTYGETNERANAVANALANVGVDEGDRVGLYLTNTPEFVFSIYGCAKLGAVETPINWQYREREVTHAIESADIATIVVQSDDEMLDVLTAVAPNTDPLERVVLTDNHRFGEVEALPGVEAYLLSDLEREAGTAEPDSNGAGWEDPVSILYTSGTTGLPKPTVLANRSFLLAAKSVLGVPFDEDDINYNPYPLFHANNQCYSMLASAIHGSEYVLSDTFSISEFFDEVTAHGVTSFNLIGGVPKMLDSTHNPEDIPENDIELAIGPISNELWEPFEEKFGLDVVQIYSQTESLTLLMNHPNLDRVRPGAIGKPMFPDFGHEAWAEDDDSNRLDPGELGELVRTDPAAMVGYYEQPLKTEETLRDGRTYSGDIVRQDEEGYFYYVDRKKFMVRRGGENISAQEVENVLDEFSGISESAIVPVPDDFYGEEVKAMVMRRDEDVTERDVVLQVACMLAPYKVPRYVEFVKNFPRTPTERIQRVKLADREKERDDHGWDRNEEFPDWDDEL